MFLQFRPGAVFHLSLVPSRRNVYTINDHAQLLVEGNNITRTCNTLSKATKIGPSNAGGASSGAMKMRQSSMLRNLHGGRTQVSTMILPSINPLRN